MRRSILRTSNSLAFFISCGQKQQQVMRLPKGLGCGNQALMPAYNLTFLMTLRWWKAFLASTSSLKSRMIAAAKGKQVEG
jgi:hypothetical protein